VTYKGEEMEKIDFNHYNNYEDFISNVKFYVSNPGCLIVENLNSDLEQGHLQNLAKSLGKISLSGVNVPGNVLEDGFIHRVEVKDEPLKDKSGYNILSSTAEVFACHTDDYFSENPVDVVILHCVIPDEFGGESIIAYINNIIDILDKNTIEILSQPTYPAHFGKVSILEKDNNEYKIRYNRLEIERASEITGISLNEEQLNALDKLDNAINKARIIFKLKKNDCLILNNKKLVHGRTSISKGSNRLLRRVRINYEQH
jgi:hypothetical protein